MRLGLFGGSFDPVHLGHLQLARSCQQQAQLDEVWFIPASTQPFKQRGAHATNDQRLEMLELATSEVASWKVSRIEIDRGGVSYTADTLRRVRELHAQTELFFLLGADSLRDFPKWREPEEILRNATPLVVARAGEEPPLFEVLAAICSVDRVEQIRQARIDMPPMEIASSTIRELVKRGEDARAMLPMRVWNYIKTNSLYI